MELQKSIVAILDDKNKIIGTGFVAGENLILTCAHVVEQATAGLNEYVTVRFAADGSKAVARDSKLMRSMLKFAFDGDLTKDNL